MSQQSVALFVCLIFVSLFCNDTESLRILGVFPMPSISHQVVFRKYTQELAKRGHELVIITPDPFLPKDRPKDNITEIDVSVGYQIMREFYKEIMEQGKNGRVELSRGVIMQSQDFQIEDLKKILQIYTAEFEHPEVQALLKDKNQKFDLIVIEAYMDFHYFIKKYFDAPVITFSSFYGTPENYAAMGAVSRHPELYPHVFRNYFKDLSITEKIKEIYNEWRLYSLMDVQLSNYQNDVLRSFLGDDAPTVQELRNNVDLLLLNAHPIFDNNRPVSPNVVYLGGGLHLQPVKKLPKELQEYLDNSKRGVIYVSLGTNVHTQFMAQEFLDQFLLAFKELPYDILWKLNDDTLEGISNNIKIQTWFPQRDLLMHPKIKLFIMQGGLQSTDEAIDAGVPLVIIPILGDQWFNAHRSQELGISVSLNSITMTSKDLLNAANEVLSNDSYKKNIIKLREVITDQPQTPMEKAIWWTEHLVRHGSGRHLRSKAANITWSEYLMLDVILAFGSAILVAVSAVLIVLFIVIKKILSSKPKTKLKKK